MLVSGVCRGISRDIYGMIHIGSFILHWDGLSNNRGLLGFIQLALRHACPEAQIVTILSKCLARKYFLERN